MGFVSSILAFLRSAPPSVGPAAPLGTAPRATALTGLVPSAPLALVHSVPPFGGARRYRASRYARHIGCRYAPFLSATALSLRLRGSPKLIASAVQ